MGDTTSSPLTSAPEEVLAKLKCGICHELLTCPPIFWYSDKGNVCGRCPIDIDGNGIRNEAFEALAQLQSLPCRYRSKDLLPLSCTDQLKWGEVQLHEESCYYRKYPCPSIPLSCSWNGSKSDLQKHYKTKHKHLIYDINNPFNIHLTSDLIENIFVEAISKPFLFHILYIQSQFTMWVGLLYFDAPDENKNYEFKIELTSRNGSFSYQGSKKYCHVANTFLLSSNVLLEINLHKLALLVQNIEDIKCYVYVSMK